MRKIESETQLMDVKDELIDRFNDYPIEVERLLEMMEIKVHALHAGVTLIKDIGKQVEVYLSEKVQQISMVKHYLNRHSHLVVR